MEPTGGRGRASKTKLALKQRRIEAVDLRIQGYSYRQIGDLMRQRHGAAVGRYNESQAYKDVMFELEKLEQKEEETARRLVQVSHMRIEQIIAAHWPYATGTRKEVMEDGEPKILDILPDRQVAEMILKAIERQSRLHGLDKLNLLHSDPDGRPLGAPGGGFAALTQEELAQTIANLQAAAIDAPDHFEELDEDDEEHDAVHGS